jgi:hypothetical protein
MEWKTRKNKVPKRGTFSDSGMKKVRKYSVLSEWQPITQQGENKFEKGFKKQTANNLPKKTKCQDVWDHATIKWHDQPEQKVPATLSKKILESVNFLKKRSES